MHKDTVGYIAAVESTRANIRLQALVLAGGMLLMAIKFAAWWLTHSNTILSDALESIVNVTAGSFALYSLWLAAKPRDREHPYGHGKVEFISAGIEGGLVVLAGGLIIWRSVQALLVHQHLHDLRIGILLSSIAGAANLGMGLMSVEQMCKTIPREAPWEAEQAAEWDRMSVGDWVRRRGNGHGDRRFRDYRSRVGSGRSEYGDRAKSG